jgi:hypothetical protein
MSVFRRGGPAQPQAGAPSGQQRLTWREKRWERRRRRRVFEEVLGWLLVPLILVGGYWLVSAVLGALGTSPGAIIDGIQAVIGAAR